MKTQFMMDFELRLEKPNVSRAWVSAATMGISYFIGMFDFFFHSRSQIVYAVSDSKSLQM